MLEQMNKLLKYLEENKRWVIANMDLSQTPCQASLTYFYDRGIALGEKEKMSSTLTSVRFLTLTWYFEKDDKERWVRQK